jgi:hypothetical protein
MSSPAKAARPSTKQPQTSQAPRFYRAICASSFTIAALGYLCGRREFHYFLFAAFFSAVGANDISLTRTVVEALRVIMGKRK